jgi:PAS domain S-box-containing protein
MTRKPTGEELENKIKLLEKAITRNRRREAALWHNQERLTQIIESIPIPTFVIDNDHIITHYNRAMENLTGISADEAVGTRNQWRAFYKDQRPSMADFIVDRATEKKIARYYKGKYRKSRVKEGAYEAEDFFAEIGGDGKWLFFTAAPLKDTAGHIFGAVETLQDTTARRRAEEERLKSERRFRTLLDFAPYSILVYSIDGLVTYLNPAFSETFGWTLEELRGKRIPYIPPDLEAENREHLKKLFDEKVILRYETRRLTKDGRILDVVWRASVFSDVKGKPAGVLVILRDITQMKRIARNNEAMLRISMALPEYPELDELLDYVGGLIKELMGAEGGVVILLDELRQELILRGAAYDDTATQKRVKEVRFAADELVAGEVINTGKPVVLNDIAGDSAMHAERDRKLGYQTRNLLQVPLRTHERTIGALCAVNKKEGRFDQTDVDLLSMLAGTVALSIENARFSNELKQAYREVSSLNRAKDKVINHLSHELKTPIAVLRTSLVTLEKKMAGLPAITWQPTVERARRNLDRLLEMQYQIRDIVGERTYKTHTMMSHLLDLCSDELEALVAEGFGEGQVVQRIRNRIEAIFGARTLVSRQVELAAFVQARLEVLTPAFGHRQIAVATRFEATPAVWIPLDPLQKIVDGLLKNAIENTPDEGKVEIAVIRKGEGTVLEVSDFGVGITEENQIRIFEGFFATQDTLNYSSRRPFDFNAGGKGSDLLRMKIFSERYHFKIDLKSTRCAFIPHDSDTCPGKISACPHCKEARGCHQAAATIFALYFPPAPANGITAEAPR